MYAELKQIVCKECGQTKPVRFYKTATLCAECSEKDRTARKAVRRAKSRKTHPEHFKALDFKNDLKRRYGLTVDQFKSIYDTQKGCCACCGDYESDFKRGLHVDHDHATGQVRALLCTRCNPGLGYFEDSVEKLEMAIKYLKKFKK